MNSMGQTDIADNLVYVVDNDVSIANLVFRTLEFQGYKCKSFYSSAAMLEEVKADHPDLIILDVMMAGMDGVTVASSLGSSSLVPIMMLSVQSDSNIKATALNVGPMTI